MTSHNSPGGRMPLAKEDYLMHPEIGQMPEGMQVVVQKCCGFSQAECDGDCEVTGSNLSRTHATNKAELDALAVEKDPAGGSYS